MIEPFVTNLVDVGLGSERNRVKYALSSLVNDGSDLARKWSAIGVRFNKVLIDLGSNHLKEIAEVSENRKVSSDRMTFLKHVVESNGR